MCAKTYEKRALTSFGHLVCYSISLWNTFHTKYLNLDVVTPRDGIRDVLDCLFVHLGAVDGKAWCCIELFVADVALEMLGLLMEYQYFVIVKFPITVPALT